MSNTSNAENEDLQTVDREFQLKEQIYKLKSQLFTSEKKIRELNMEYAQTIISLKEELNRLQNGINKLHSQKHTMIALSVYDQLAHKNEEMAEEIQNLHIEMQKQAEQRLTPNFDDPNGVVLNLEKDNEIAKLKSEIEQWKNDCMKWRDECLQRRKSMDEYNRKSMEEYSKSSRLNVTNGHKTTYHVNPFPSSSSSTSYLHPFPSNEREQSLTDNLASYYESKLEEERSVWQKKQTEYELEITHLQSDRKQTVSHAIVKMSEEIVQLQNSLTLKEMECEKVLSERGQLQKLHSYNAERLKEKVDVLERELKKREGFFIEQKHLFVEERQGLIDQKDRLLQERDEQLQENNALIMEKKSLLREREIIVRERDSHKREYQAILKTRDSSSHEITSIKHQLQSQIQELIHNNTSLQQQNAQKEQILAQIKPRYQDSQKSLLEARRINQKIGDELQKVSQENNNLKIENKKQLQDQEQHYNQINEIMKIEIQETKKEHSKMKAQLKEKAASLTTMTMNLRNVQTDYKNLKHLFDELQEKYNNLLLLEQQLKSMKEELERERIRQTRQNEQLKRIKQLNSVQVAANAIAESNEIIKLNDKILVLTIELTKINKQLDEKQAQLVQTKKECSSYKEEFVRQKEQSSGLREQMKLKNKELQHIKKEQRSLEKLHENQHFSFGPDKARWVQLEEKAERERQRSQSLLLQMASTERELSIALLQLSSKEEQIRKLKSTAHPTRLNSNLTDPHNPFHMTDPHNHYHRTDPHSYLRTEVSERPFFSPKTIIYEERDVSHYQRKAPFTHRREGRTDMSEKMVREIEEQNDELRYRAKEIEEERNAWKKKYRELKNNIAVCPHVDQRTFRNEHAKKPSNNQEKGFIPKVSRI